ncbi:regulatory protein GemA [Tistlia consotensis]|uniref:regulatory protein GemA n=1 Tax=Tistlia consotensis TaxID=1321365 RepID=UPI0013565FB6|nr:regulatory protein GemA [Tistlia consotensis]
MQIARRQLALDDGTYRALLKRVTGKESSTELSIAELDQVLAEFARLGWTPKPRSAATGAPRSGPGAGRGRKPAEGPLAGKLRALWLSGYWLGVVDDPSETALAHWCERVTGGRGKGGVAALQWLDGAGFNKSVESLKAALARDAGVDWRPYYRAGQLLGEDPRARVLEAQWRRLAELGVVSNGGWSALDRWLAGRPGLPADADRLNLTPNQADQAIRDLGRMLRQALGKSLPEDASKEG